MQDRKSEYAALLLRVTLGVMFIAHGLLKIVVFTLPMVSLTVPSAQTAADQTGNFISVSVAILV